MVRLLLVIIIFPVTINTFSRSVTGKEKWDFYESPAFRIFYASGNETEAEEAAQFLESEYDRVTETMGYIPVEKTEIYLISQGDIDLKPPRSSSVGKVMIDNKETDKQLLKEFARCLLNKMYSKKDMRYLHDWFLAGVSAYVAGLEPDHAGVSETTFEPVNLKLLKEEDAMIAGNLIWNYLVKMNGEGAVAHILNSARILQSDKGAIEQFVGVPFEMVMNNCRKYYYE